MVPHTASPSSASGRWAPTDVKYVSGPSGWKLAPGAVSPTGPSVPSAVDSTTPTAAPDEDGGSSVWWWILAAVVVVALAGGLLWLRRRRAGGVSGSAG
jgi:LPXTG-motif cell wall-anchored protein